MKKYKKVFKSLVLLSISTLIGSSVVACDAPAKSEEGNNSNERGNSHSPMSRQLLNKVNSIKSLIKSIEYPSPNASAKKELNDQLDKIISQKNKTDADKLTELNILESRIKVFKTMVLEYKIIISKLPKEKQIPLKTELDKISNDNFSNLKTKVFSAVKYDLKDKIDNLAYPNINNPKNDLKSKVDILNFDQIIQKYNEIEQLSKTIDEVLIEINSLPYPTSNQILDEQLAVEYFKEKLSSLSDQNAIKRIIPKDLKDKIIKFKDIILLLEIDVPEWKIVKEDNINELNAKLQRFTSDNHNDEYSEKALIYSIYETFRNNAFYPKINSLSGLTEQDRNEYLSKIPVLSDGTKNNHNISIDELKDKVVLMNELAKKAEDKDLKSLQSKNNQDIVEDRIIDHSLNKMLIEHLKNDQLKNTELGKYLKDQGVTQTLFLKDVNPKFSEFVHHIDTNDNIDSWWYAHNDRDEGWFDINKEFGRGDNFLCGAIVVVNILHYWSQQNKDYLDRYLSDPQKGIITFKNSTNSFSINFRDLNTFIEQTGNEGIKTKKENSKLFEWIKKDYGGNVDKRSGKGFVTPFKLFDELINGYGYFRIGYKSQIQNNPSDWDPKANWKGFFKDVFKSNILSGRWPFNNAHNAKNLSNRLKNEILANKPFAISHTYGSSVVNHIINVWGADFGKDGIVKALYVTDSDDPFAKFTKNGEQKRLAIKRYKVDFDKSTGKVYLGAKTNNKTQALDIYTFDLGTKYWEDYFKNKQ
ncbi:IdeS/Mac family cysteine endopeptidase [Mycoplasmopsis cynos]|uniref:IdeS/Mac family cysteine endopeptidase n=1 Tax=Mycoplasmopsis cynos TaxID=171284 RepID=UPI002AFFD2A8|nr:IdeS/Mac family cysteine endopeptidase [Mycoplasmopsis cynos]WQQ16884.1 IdeS/Mac family cysteine endopeptidase [Mycoplasmopsis cynos]